MMSIKTAKINVNIKKQNKGNFKKQNSRTLVIMNLLWLNLVNFFWNPTTVVWSWNTERVCRHHLILKGNVRSATISSSVTGCIFGEMHVNLSHA